MQGRATGQESMGAAPAGYGLMALEKSVRIVAEHDDFVCEGKYINRKNKT